MTDLDNISNVVNDILINEINQTDGVFQQEDIVIDDNIFVGEEVCKFFQPCQEQCSSENSMQF